MPDRELPSEELTERVRARINAARRATWVAPLATAQPLVGAAQEHATAMVRRDFYDFVGPDGIEATDRARGRYTGRVDVLILRGHTVPEQAVDDMLTDAECRETLLNAEFCDLGVGECERRWTFLLGTGQAAQPSAPAPAGAPMTPPASTPPPASALSPPPASPSSPVAVAGSLPSTASPAPAARSEASARSVEVARDLVAPAPPPPVALELPAKALRQQVLDLINHHRDLGRLPLCTASPQLEQAAQLHSIDMFKRDFFAYQSADGHSVIERGQQAGYRGRMQAVIAQGIDTPELLCDALLGPQSQHRKHLLAAEVRHLGVGTMRGRWTLICGVPLAENDPQHVQQLLQLLNQERQRAGVPTLTLSEPLGRAAQAHATDMVQRGYFNFAHADGGGFESQLKSVGFPGAAIPAIAKGHATADAALDQWLRSEGNRKNLLDSRYRLLGVGVAASHWTVILGVAA